MKSLIVVVAILFMVFLNGCANDGTMNITKLPVSDKTVTTISGDITDASTQKEALFFNARTAHDTEYVNAYKESGFKQTWKEVTKKTRILVKGEEIVIESTDFVPEVTFKERPEFQPMPEGPSEHPFWKFATSFVKQVKDGFLFYTGIMALDNTLNNGINAAQPKYYGNYNPQTAKPYEIRPEVVIVK